MIPLLVGCQNEEESVISLRHDLHSFVATIEGNETASDTRTTVDNDGQVSWIESDQLGVFGNQTMNALFQSTGQGTVVTFTGSLEKADEEVEWAYFPYDEEATFTDQTLTFELPDHYDYSGTSYAPMLAVKGSGSKLGFHHLCGLLKITLGGGIPDNADKLVISSIGEEAPSLSGKAVVDDIAATDAILRLPFAGGNKVSYSVENVSPIEKYQTIFVPLPVGRYPKLEVSFYVKENDTPLFTRAISNLNVRRAVMTSMPILNWRTGEQFVLNNATKVLSDINEGSIEINNAESTSLSYHNVSASDVPTVGEVLWSKVTDEYPNGFLGKVTDVIDDGNGNYTVKTEPAALSEVFDELYVDETISLEPEITTRTRASEEMNVFGYKITTEKEIQLGGEEESGSNSPFYCNGKFQSGQELTATFILNKQDNIERAALSLVMGSKIGLTYGMKGSISSQKFEHDIMSLKFKSIPLANGIIQVTPVIDLKFIAEANGEFENSMTFSSESQICIGAEYKDRTWQSGKNNKNKSKNESPWDFSGKLSFSGHLSTKMEAECAFKLYNLEHMKVAVSPYISYNLEGSIEVNEENSESLVDILDTAHLDSYFEVGGGIEVDASLFSDRLQKSIEISPVQFGKRKLYLLPRFKDLNVSIKKKNNSQQEATISTEVKRELLSKDTKIAIMVNNGSNEIVKNTLINYSGSVENGIVDETEPTAPEANPLPMKEIVEELTANESYVAKPIVQSPIFSNTIELETKSVSFSGEMSLRDQLIQLYKDTDGDHWKNNDNWCSNQPIEEWYGISKSKYSDGYRIELIDNNVKGSIRLSHKHVDYVSIEGNNNLTGIDLSGCINIDRVDVWDNENLESIDLSNCDNLTTICFQRNQNLQRLSCKNCPLLNVCHMYKTIAEYVDISNCTSLDTWAVSEVGFDKKTTHFNASGCKSLSGISGSSYYEYLDLSGCSKLDESGCGAIYMTKNIKTLKLRDWTHLTNLSSLNNTIQIDTLDLSGCVNLRQIIDGVNHNPNNPNNPHLNISVLCIVGCTSLEEVDLNPSAIEYLDISDINNPTTDFFTTFINNLNLSRYCPNLKSLLVRNSELGSLYAVAENLQYVNVENSKITNLYLPRNTNPTIELKGARISNISGFGSYFITDISFPEEVRSISLNFSDGESIDFSKFVNLEKISIKSPSLLQLDLRNQGSNLKTLSIRPCPNLQVLNLEGCSSLESIDCSESKITSLNISHCTNLKELNCSKNQIANIDLSTCTNLTSLDCSNNKLVVLDTRDLPHVSKLYCSGNRLSNLDLSNCQELSSLRCADNELSFLDVTKCPNLVDLDFEKNNINTIDLSNCKSLIELYCSNNPNLSIDVSNYSKLVFLYCDNVNEVNASSCVMLEYCSFSNVISLDISNNGKLRPYRFDFSDSNIQSLNISNCDYITNIDISNSKIQSVNISGCWSLNYLDISNTKCLQELTMDTDNRNLKTFKALGSSISHEIPNYCSFGLDTFEYEQRYTYSYTYETDKYGDEIKVVHVKDNGIGWWYPGEPETGAHKRK